MYIMATYKGLFYDCDKTNCKSIDEYKKTFVICSDKIIFTEVTKEKYLELEKFEKLLKALRDSFEYFLAIGDYQRQEEDFFNNLKNEDDKKFYKQSLEDEIEKNKFFYAEIETNEENF